MVGIYGFLNKENGKWYIGQSVQIQKRINTHLWKLRNGEHRNELLQSEWNHFGESAFSWTILEECEPQHLNEREIHWIAQKKAFGCGYNQSAGGYGRRVISESEKRWRSKRFSGAGNPFYGKKHSPETLVKLSELKKGARHVNYGKHLSPETRAKISAAQKGRPCPESKKKKLSEANKGKAPTRATIEKAREFSMSPENPLCRAVVCVETGVEYFSASEAARQTGCSRTKITACCSGRRKSTGGFHWKYLEDK